MDVTEEEPDPFERLKEEMQESVLLSKKIRFSDARRAKNVSKEAFWFRIKLLIGLLCLVGFFASNVYFRTQKFPQLYAWHERAKSRSENGKGQNYDLTHVVISAYNRPFTWIMNTLLIWPDLNDHAAKFLIFCINQFEYVNTKTRGKLSLLHWNGNGEQNGFANLFKPDGWLCSSHNTQNLDENTRLRNLYSNWQASRTQNNIWYDFFPDNVDDFIKIEGIKELVQRGGGICQSGSNNYSPIATLFDGGLCAVAKNHMVGEMTSHALFKKIFLVNAVEPQVNCDLMQTEGAMNGLLGFGMVATGLPVSAPIMAGLSVAFSGIGYIVGGQAGKERCLNASQ